jgi:peptidyl-prolyl cis-trans isomerase A (cyclophilin A)
MKYFSLFFVCFSFMATAKDVAIDPANLFPQIKFETSMGVIIVELDRIKAPLTVDNFLTYVVTGEYNNTIFHRVLADFIVQGGGYDKNFIERTNNGTISNESGNGLKNEIGTIAMAKEHKPHTANRQFFFNIADNSSLDPGRKWGYTVFGSVIEGEEIIAAMGTVKTDYNEEMGWADVPVEAIILIKATLLPAT